jgi:hypothetical protein
MFHIILKILTHAQAHPLFQEEFVHWSETATEAISLLILDLKATGLMTFYLFH